MWPFTVKKPEKELNSDEYERILKRLLDFEHRLSILELDREDFRNKVLRKIQKPREEAPIEEQATTGMRLFGGHRR